MSIDRIAEANTEKENLAMREATIMLPLFDNHGASLDGAHKLLRERILHTFGGLTAETVQGAWIGDDGKEYWDQSMRYTIAAEANATNNNVLHNLAIFARMIGRQEAIYTRNFDGNVQIVAGQGTMPQLRDAG